MSEGAGGSARPASAERGPPRDETCSARERDATHREYPTFYYTVVFLEISLHQFVIFGLSESDLVFYRARRPILTFCSLGSTRKEFP